MSVQLRTHNLAEPGRMRFSIMRTGRPGEPEKAMITGTVIGEEIHWEAVIRPPLFPSELEDMAKALQEAATEARKHQNKQTRRQNHGGSPPSDTDLFGA